jgi:hypothetical protein
MAQRHASINGVPILKATASVLTLAARGHSTMIRA